MSLDIMNDQPIVQAGRYVLRPVRQSDIGLMTLYAGDERVARMTTSIPHPLPPGAIEAFVKRATAPDRVEDVWIIDGTPAEGSEVMGVIGLKRVDTGQVEIGYWVAPPFWNTGLASDAVRTLIEANPLKNDTLFASVFQDNPASARVLVNCGFDYIGDAEAFSVARSAKVPTWTYIRKLAR